MVVFLVGELEGDGREQLIGYVIASMQYGLAIRTAN